MVFTRIKRARHTFWGNYLLGGSIVRGNTVTGYRVPPCSCD